MSAPTMGTLARRLDRMERENRRLKSAGAVALGVITALVLLGQATEGKAPKVVEAEEFVLRDAKGTIRGMLTMGPHNSPNLLLSDETRIRGRFGLDADGSPILVLIDNDGTDRASLGIGSKGIVRLSVFDKEGIPRVWLGTLADGSPLLGVTDKAGRTLWSAP